MGDLHPVLKRQLRRLELDPSTLPAGWQDLFERVSQTYTAADQERYTLERSITISSKEMQDLYAQLAEERDKLQAIFTSMGDGLCVTNAKGEVQLINPEGERVLGIAPSDIAGRDLISVICNNKHGALGNPIADALRGCLTSGKECRFEDAYFFRTDGSAIPISVVLAPIIRDDVVVGLVLAFRDITERKRAEEVLRNSEAQFRSIFESTAVGMIRLTTEGRLVQCNPAFRSMVGLTEDEVLARSDGTNLVHPEDRDNARRLFSELVQGQLEHYSTERRYIHKDGSIVWAYISMSMVRDPSGNQPFAVGVVENITERKRLEVELRHAQKLESVGRLAAGIAHEINTPIQFVGDNTHFLKTTFEGFFNMVDQCRSLREKYTDLNPKYLDEVARAEEEAEVDFLQEDVPNAIEHMLDGISRVATIVRAMKCFAHPDRGEESATDINQAIESTLAVARNELKYVSNVETNFGSLPPVICYLGDLNQVFLNLFVSAAHAIADVVGDSGDKGTIRVRTWCEGDDAIIAVSDTGTGIPHEIQGRIFDPFFTTKDVGQGTGQGLALARSVIVEKHRGSLTFETEPNQGTTFFIRLPIMGPKSKTREAA